MKNVSGVSFKRFDLEPGVIYTILFGGLVSFLDTNQNIKSLVIGISGGIDSTICAAVCRNVIDYYSNSRSNRKIKLIGVSMPIKNSEKEIESANMVLEAFCDEKLTLDLKEEYETILSSLEDKNSLKMREKIRRGNIQCRLRMLHLYDIAFHNHGIVISTTNFTEWMLGFFTLHGDTGDYEMLIQVNKTSIFKMASWMITDLKPIYTKAEAIRALSVSLSLQPTDGLGITETNIERFDNIPYEVIDKHIDAYLNGKTCANSIREIINKSEFKREHPVIMGYVNKNIR